MKEKTFLGQVTKKSLVLTVTVGMLLMSFCIPTSAAFAADENNSSPTPERFVEETNKPSGGPFFGVDVSQVERIYKYKTTNWGQILAGCTVYRKGATCTIVRTKTATRTIEAGFGLSRAAVAAQLGISASDSQSTAIHCASPPLSQGQTWRAYPNGYKHSYKIKRTTMLYGTTYSKTLFAFDPIPNEITCA